MLIISGVRPLACTFSAVALLSLFLFLPSGPAKAQELRLSDVLRRTMASSPVATANAARIQAAEAGIDQADVRPNPALAAEVEDFGGSGAYSKFGESQASLYYEQKLELGGKRQARTGLARTELNLARNKADLKMLDLLAEVQAAWIEAVASEERLPVMQRRLSEARSLEREVARRTERGLDPAFARDRARVSVAQAETAYEQAKDTARLARDNLASYWGGASDFELDRKPFLDTRIQIETDDLTDESAPDLQTLKAQRETAGAQMELEKAQAVQDPTLRAGVRRFSNGNDVAFVVGFSIPLAFHDTNRGNIARAQADRLAAEADFAAGKISRQREVLQLVSKRKALAAEISRLDREILPSATRAATSVRDGFQRGGGAFTLLEVTEAQKAASESRLSRIDLLRRFHLLGARLDRLAGTHLTEISNPVNNQ